MNSKFSERNGEDTFEAYLVGCRLCRWRLNCIRRMILIINSVDEMRKYGAKMALHIGNQFGNFDLCA